MRGDGIDDRADSLVMCTSCFGDVSLVSANSLVSATQGVVEMTACFGNVKAW